MRALFIIIVILLIIFWLYAARKYANRIWGLKDKYIKGIEEGKDEKDGTGKD